MVNSPFESVVTVTGSPMSLPSASCSCTVTSESAGKSTPVTEVLSPAWTRSGVAVITGSATSLAARTVDDARSTFTGAMFGRSWRLRAFTVNDSSPR